MIYYEKRDDKLYKMECTYDGLELSMLKKIVIFNCSVRKYFEYNCVESEVKKINNMAHLGLVKGLSVKFDGYYEHEQGPDVPKYLVKYFGFQETKLVNIIKKFINGDVSAIKELNEYEIEEAPYEKIKLEIDSLSSEIDKIPNKDYKEKIKELTKLGGLYRQLEKNLNTKSTEEYYNNLKELISFRELSSFDYEEAINFFGEDKVSRLILK